MISSQIAEQQLPSVGWLGRAHLVGRRRLPVAALLLLHSSGLRHCLHWCQRIGPVWPAIVAACHFDLFVLQKWNYELDLDDVGAHDDGLVWSVCFELVVAAPLPHFDS